MNNLQLIEAVKTGNLPLIQTLLASDADVNQQDEQGWTALNFAAAKGDLKTIQSLLAGGADVFKTGRDCRTPYMIALAADRIDAARLLKEQEARSETTSFSYPQRKYCRAYALSELRKFAGSGSIHDPALDDSCIVFLHQDYCVTTSIYPDEDVIFSEAGTEWKTFCDDVLGFRVPSDFELAANSSAETVN